MATRRSTGRHHVAQALWYVGPGQAEIRPQRLTPAQPDHVLVRTEFSGISRGTERLVASGHVPASEHDRMRAPLQEGEFPFPVKYGYCAVGQVEDGPPELSGLRVFCLHPHQDLFAAPINMVVPIPENIPAKRATLAANMETALNAHWDAASGPADHIVIVGAGIVGLLVTYLAASLPGSRIEVFDTDPAKRDVVEALGATFRQPGDQNANADIVFHTSASEAGLVTAIDNAGLEARIIELSWYGNQAITASLGGAFHSRRLQLHSSQVGQVSAGRRARWSYRRRMEAALSLLDNPVLDRLVSDEISFADAPNLLPNILTGDGLAPVIRY